MTPRPPQAEQSREYGPFVRCPTCGGETRYAPGNPSVWSEYFPDGAGELHTTIACSVCLWQGEQVTPSAPKPPSPFFPEDARRREERGR